MVNDFFSHTKKVGFTTDNVSSLLDWLSRPPQWTTIRINKTKLIETDSSIGHSLRDVQIFVNNSFDSLNEQLLNSDPNAIKRQPPECKILSEELINECIKFSSSCSISNGMGPSKLSNVVIIDSKCAQAVLRGADIFIPGIIGLSKNAKAGDEVSIYVDLNRKCLKGADANAFISNNLSGSESTIKFIGNGWLMLHRDDVFKINEKSKSGVGIRIKELLDNSYIPSFDKLDDSRYYIQNLPSIICARVLDPKENELILDMCAAPGGKTTHLAELVSNKSRIIAFDKISSKIERMKDLCAKLDANCVECVCQDATNIDFEKYKPESFDKILVDAPCSALGQRPLLYNDITVKQLSSYISYQRMILDNAVKLLKPGGCLVYSTCTITLEENEEQISWLLNKYKNLRLVDQEPYNYSISSGLPCKGLNDEQLKKLQRFMPNFANSSHHDLAQFTQNVYFDTIGFFISKLIKDF